MNWKLIRIIDAYAGIPLLYALAAFRKLFNRRSSRHVPPLVRTILLVKFWGIGNIFMMLPSAAALRRTYPDAEIDLLTLESSRQAAECAGAFNRIETVDTRGGFEFLKTTRSMILALRRREYDVIVDFEQFARFSAICIALIGKRTTIGFNTAAQRRHYLFTRPVAYDNTMHVTRSYCTLVESAGTAAGSCHASSLSILPEPQERAAGAWARLGIGADPFIIFHVGTSSNFKERRWPASSYAALADSLIEKHGVRIVLTGLAEERFVASEVIALVRSRDRLVNAAGIVSFQEYFDLIRSSRLVISADTAAVHIASAIGVPVVGLYGPNTPQLYGPWEERGLAVYEQLSCSPCITNFNAKTHNCRHPQGKGACMRKISAKDVDRLIEEHYGDLFTSPDPAEQERVEPCSR
jgi:ADP-heptose:LPS heptosyltransferase